MANRNLCRYDDDDDDDRDDEEEKGPIKGIFIKENNLGGVEYTRACNDQFHSHPLSVQVEEKRKEMASRAADELVDHKERKATATGTPWIPDGTEAERKRERKRERERRVERTRWQPDRIRVETQTASHSLIHRGLYQNLITSEAKATAREER